MEQNQVGIKAGLNGWHTVILLVIGVAAGIGIAFILPNKVTEPSTYNLSICQNQQCGKLDGIKLVCESKASTTECGLFFTIGQ